MDCRQANRLLPLWIGRDLADASESEALREHLSGCARCGDRRLKLQESLEALQSVSSGMLESQSVSRRGSVWPALAVRLGEFPRRRDQFNGWIPAAAMAMAAGMMLAVSIVQFQREMGDVDPTGMNAASADGGEGRNLFNTDRQFAPGTRNRQASSGLVKLNNW